MKSSFEQFRYPRGPFANVFARLRATSGSRRLALSTAFLHRNILRPKGRLPRVHDRVFWANPELVLTKTLSSFNLSGGFNRLVCLDRVRFCCSMIQRDQGSRRESRSASKQSKKRCEARRGSKCPKLDYFLDVPFEEGICTQNNALHMRRDFSFIGIWAS